MSGKLRCYRPDGREIWLAAGSCVPAGWFGPDCQLVAEASVVVRVQDGADTFEGRAGAGQLVLQSEEQAIRAEESARLAEAEARRVAEEACQKAIVERQAAWAAECAAYRADCHARAVVQIEAWGYPHLVGRYADRLPMNPEMEPVTVGWFLAVVGGVRRRETEASVFAAAESEGVRARTDSWTSYVPSTYDAELVESRGIYDDGVRGGHNTEMGLKPLPWVEAAVDDIAARDAQSGFRLDLAAEARVAALGEVAEERYCAARPPYPMVAAMVEAEERDTARRRAVGEAAAAEVDLQIAHAATQAHRAPRRVAAPDPTWTNRGPLTHSPFAGLSLV